MGSISIDKVKELIKDFVNFSSHFLTLDSLEGISDERLKKMEHFSVRFLEIFNTFKTEKDFDNFKNMYEKLEVNEKRVVLELIGHTKNQKFSDFLFDIAKSNSFYSVDAIISLGQIDAKEKLSDLEALLDGSKDEVYSKVLKSVIYGLKKEYEAVI